MSRLTPSTAVLANPVGFDEVIAYYQILFGTLQWPDHKSLGRAYEQTENGNRLPKIYDGKREYYTALPNDRLNSYSFLMARSQERREDEGGLERDMTVVFWVDLRKVRAGFDTPTVEPLRLEVEQLIKDAMYTKEITGYYDERIDDIFMGYIDLENENKYLMFPYAGFRIDFTVGYPVPCGEPLDSLITITRSSIPQDYVLLKLGNRVAKLMLLDDGGMLTTQLEEI